MASVQLSVLSTEYIGVPVTVSTLNGPADPTGDVVQFAFLPVGQEPQVSSWTAGSWADGQLNGQYAAQILVGPAGAVTLPEDTYVIWLKIADTPETPVRQCGYLLVTS